jgi:hypothetical protein
MTKKKSKWQKGFLKLIQHMDDDHLLTLLIQCVTIEGSETVLPTDVWQRREVEKELRKRLKKIQQLIDVINGALV